MSAAGSEALRTFYSDWLPTQSENPLHAKTYTRPPPVEIPMTRPAENMNTEEVTGIPHWANHELADERSDVPLEMQNNQVLVGFAPADPHVAWFWDLPLEQQLAQEDIEGGMFANGDVVPFLPALPPPANPWYAGLEFPPQENDWLEDHPDYDDADLQVANGYYVYEYGGLHRRDHYSGGYFQ